MDRVARNRRYYEAHRDELLRKKREKRADAEYREREKQKWSEWYRRNAEFYKLARALDLKVEDARRI